MRWIEKNPITVACLVLVMLFGATLWRMEAAISQIEQEASATIEQTETISEVREVLAQQTRTVGAINCVLGLLFVPVGERPALADRGDSSSLPPACEALTDAEYEALFEFVQGD